MPPYRFEAGITTYLPLPKDFILFFFPQAHGDIEWSRDYEFLDKELQQVVRDNLINLFHFIDWLMGLPADLEQEFQQQIQQLEEERRMPYITSFERIGIQKGIRQGLLEGIELGLKLKFGSEGLSLLAEISEIQNVEQLRTIMAGLETANTLDGLRQIYQPTTSD